MDLSTHQPYDRIAKFLSGNMSPEENVRFQEWLEEDPAHQQLLEEALMVWQAGEEESLPDFEKDVDGAWKKVALHIQRDHTETKPAGPEPSVPVIRPVFRRWIAGVAAAIAVLAVGTWMWINRPDFGSGLITHSTGAGETLLVELPDSSRVWLNEHSTLSYQTRFEVRSLELKGEAFFEVTRMEDSPFVVHSGGARTEVLGTSFNIRAYPGEDRVELTVETGKVAFSPDMQPEARLEVEAGSSAVLKEATAQPLLSESRIADALSWRTGNLEFDEHATMEMVRLSFERFYGIRLQAEDSTVWNCHYKGSFDQAPPEKVAESIAFVLNLELMRSDSVYTFLGSGCESQ